MIRAVILLAALAVGVGASAGAVPEGCDGVDATLFAEAQRAHRTGRFNDALRNSTKLTDCYPDNVDYVFQRALALAALGSDREALDAALEAQALAPDYAAVTKLAERLQVRLDRQADAEEAQAPAPTPAASRWFANALVAAHDLSGPRDGWSNAAVGVRFARPDGLSIAGRLEFERRGDVRDTSVAGDAVYPLAPRWRLTGRAALTPGADFRPETFVAAGAEHDLAGGWVTRAEIAQRRFDDDRADSVTLGADYYVASFRLAAAATLSRLTGAGNALGTVASVDWYANDRHRYRVTVGLGDELDTIDETGAVLESRVRSLTLSGEHDVTDRLALGWWLGTVEQGRFYDRRHAGLLVTRRY